ncbi:MAG: urease accessory protein UreF [Labedaea sp.]
MDLTALLLADSRFPGGGHAHSGGVEEAAAIGRLSTVDELAAFLCGRLRTAGLLAAVFAAAAAHAARRRTAPEFWPRLSAELDARTPSPAQREASRAQGNAVLRALRALPSANPPSQLDTIFPPAGSRPHHCVALGVAVGTAGGAPLDAALVAAYLSVSGPASAAVRLLGLDPFAVNAVVMALAADIRAVAGQAADTAATDPADLPAPGAPGLDLLAEAHRHKHQKEVRLFAS